MKPMTVDEALAHAKIHAVAGGAQDVLASEVVRLQQSNRDLVAALKELRDWYEEFSGLPACNANAAINRAEGGKS